MTSGNRSACALAALLLTLAPGAPGAELELDALLARLARPAPATTPFVEARWSSLLKTPLVSSGTLEYRGPDALARHVLAPYREDTEIAAGEVRMTREGQRPQKFPLSRAPELHGLLTGFSALLGGDRAALEREFEVGVALGREGWTLELTPRAERTRKRIGRIAIEGRGSEPRCFTVDGSGENASVMLLGSAAEAPLPEPLERAALEQRCADGD